MMTFFTYDWWKSLQTPTPQANPALDYKLHLGRIRKHLTSELLRLEEGISLHDGFLRRLRLDVAAGRMEMTIDLDDWDKPPCAVQLLYGAVSIVESTAPRNDILGGQFGFGQLGYLETDVTDGGFEHRILFSSGVELRIAFGGFHLKLGKKPNNG